ncbi:MAG: hypothetical protein ACKO9Q_26945, partial [Pirellula sp.]
MTSSAPRKIFEEFELLAVSDPVAKVGTKEPVAEKIRLNNPFFEAVGLATFVPLVLIWISHFPSWIKKAVAPYSP